MGDDVYLSFRPSLTRSLSLSHSHSLVFEFFFTVPTRVYTNTNLQTVCVCVCVCVCHLSTWTATSEPEPQAPCLIGGCSFVCNSRFFFYLVLILFFHRVHVIYMAHPRPSPSLLDKH